MAARYALPSSSGRVIEQLAVRRECRVHVRQPEQQQLLERYLAVRATLGLAGEVCLGRHVAAIRGHVGEVLDEGRQRGVERRRAEPLAQVGHGRRHDAGLAFAAVKLHHEVEHLVDQSHRVEIAGTYRCARVGGQVALPVHCLREATGRGEVDEDDVPGRAEERLVELVAIARSARNVELEGHRDEPLITVDNADPHRAIAPPPAQLSG